MESTIEGITLEDIKRYTMGECWLLAETLNRKTDWPILIIAVSEKFRERRYSHAGILHPSGLWLDICGLNSIEKVFEEYGDLYLDMVVKEITWARLRWHVYGNRKRTMPKNQPEDVNRIAEIILNQIKN